MVLFKLCFTPKLCNNFKTNIKPLLVFVIHIGRYIVHFGRLQLRPIRYVLCIKIINQYGGNAPFFQSKITENNIYYVPVLLNPPTKRMT